ncbi:conserved hypothetical protein [Leishmania mexicana MHOM/GT/2001/U1103]|uniref:COX assembly mitochondrial protein n=1 Tax=Leishmania mexicana (strain MHOM/GT/2001/U1103) TaxID=929439 RepID=E9AJB5_LEIMU|nr:conserved hypothetical protein [Leishmania mexicana MHOM/GT/2001/U1103]CBZ23012.1 conserved hypothetical protein [Leishmania mexicana MHOM/GT/2001/U1103]
MSTYDKSDQIGYDETDNTLNAELEDMIARTPPEVQRHLQHRIHDGILQRMKEETTRKCITFIQKYEQCVNSQKPYNMKLCYPHRDAMNGCAQEVNREENYQRYRIMYLRGELLRYHEKRIADKMEAFKVKAPDAIRAWKHDYAPKYMQMMADLGVAPLGNAVETAEETTNSK